MAGDNDEDRKRQVAKVIAAWATLDRLLLASFAVFGVVVAISFSTDRFRLAANFDEFPVPQLSVMLLFVTVTLSAGWFFAVSGEMRMLRNFGEEFLSVIPESTGFLGFGVAIFLAVLVHSSDKPILYSILYAGFNLIEVWTLWIRDSKIREALVAARATGGTDDRRQAWDVIEQYYFGNPQMPLAATILFLCFVAFALAMYAELGEQPTMRQWVSAGSYMTLMGAIALNFSAYTKWRSVRSRQLGETYLG